jgi:hypothetical protein
MKILCVKTNFPDAFTLYRVYEVEQRGFTMVFDNNGFNWAVDVRHDGSAVVWGVEGLLMEFIKVDD